MSRISKAHKNRKVENPASHFDRPRDVVLYVAAYPIILLCWKLPHLIFKQQSWTLAETIKTVWSENVTAKNVAKMNTVPATNLYRK
jgi:hypothetical protein